MFLNLKLKKFFARGAFYWESIFFNGLLSRGKRPPEVVAKSKNMYSNLEYWSIDLLLHFLCYVSNKIFNCPLLVQMYKFNVVSFF